MQRRGLGQLQQVCGHPRTPIDLPPLHENPEKELEEGPLRGTARGACLLHHCLHAEELQRDAATATAEQVHGERP